MKMPDGYYVETQTYVAHEDGFRYLFRVVDEDTLEVQYQERGGECGWTDRGTPMTFDVNVAEAIAAQIIAVAKAHKEAGQ